MGINIGMSGNEKDAYGSDRQLGLGEVPWSDYSPRLDLAYRLAEIANQYGAQENLMFGGAGYGGSFETAAQKAQRASGQPVDNTKPYGGWGGYGSSNPTQYWDPTGTRPDWNNGVPVYGAPPSGGGQQPLPGGIDSAKVPPPTGVAVPSTGGGQTIPGYTPPKGVPGPGEAAMTAGAGASQPEYINDRGVRIRNNQYVSPDAQWVMDQLGAQGITHLPGAGNAQTLLSGGASKEDILKHYQSIYSKYPDDPSGYKAYTAGHGANFIPTRDTVNKINSGVYGQTSWTSDSTGPRSQERVDFINRMRSQRGLGPSGAAAPTGPSSAFIGGNENPYEAFSVATAPAPGGTTANSNATDDFWGVLRQGVDQITNSPGFKEWVTQQSWDGQGGKTPGKATAPDGPNMTVTDVPAGAEASNTLVKEKNIPLDALPDNGEGWEPVGVRPGKFTHPDFGGYQSYTRKNPNTGKIETVTIPNRFDFEQGDNGPFTTDYWSTSPTWRPEAPTGGLYGAFSELASGQLTPYENRIGEGWQGYATNPVGWADENFQNALGQYQSTPGKGIDEAYGAYNRMLQGDGYSAAEKGAIEGSAVRGVTQGFQRGADDMRRQAARTGNAAAPYAAMASMGAQYGGQLGEMGRQNQLKFADEAQRRQEVGGQGMTNVASLANQKAQFGLQAGSSYANELARRKEAGLRGAGDYAAFGRGLQQQGLAGLNQLMQQQQQGKQSTYAMIANLLNQGTGSANLGSSSGWGWGAGIGGSS